MKLVPFSKSVTVAVEGKAKSNSSSVEIKVHGPKGVTYVVAVHQMGIGKIDRTKKMPLTEFQIAAAYWLVRPVQDKSMTNMRKSTMTCTLTVAAGDETAPHRVIIPILQNVKAVKKGDELVLFTEPVVPKSTMPAQKLEPQPPTMKRPAAAPPRRTQKPAKRCR